VKLPAAAALAGSAFAARRFLIPSRSASLATSVQCLSRPGTGTTDTEISFDACLHATLETSN